MISNAPFWKFSFEEPGQTGRLSLRFKLLVTNLEMRNQLTKVDGSVLKLTTLSGCSFNEIYKDQRHSLRKN